MKNTVGVMVAAGRIVRGQKMKIETPFEPFLEAAQVINNAASSISAQKILKEPTLTTTTVVEDQISQTYQSTEKVSEIQLEIPSFMQEYSRKKRLEKSLKEETTTSNVIQFPQKMAVDNSQKSSLIAGLEQKVKKFFFL